MRFSYVAISSSSAYALSAYINPSAKNPNCVYNVDDCNSMSGNCCANQELCGVQECLLHVMTVCNIQFDNKTNSPISNVKKHSDIFFGSETVIEGSKNFCDDEFTFYGQIEELKLWCDPVQGRVKGISARHGPKPGESKYAWSMIHGSSNNEPEDEKWLLWGHNISEVIFRSIFYLSTLSVRLSYSFLTSKNDKKVI